MIDQKLDHYQVLQKIGEGAIGEVYLAYDTKLNRNVALKFLSSRLLQDVKARQRFLREARTAAALNHPNVVTVHEIGEINEYIYIAMEYIEGKNLAEIIAEQHPLPVETIIHIAREICIGLETAHNTGIIHRDIKPGNIILDEDNRLKIMDFGLAKFKDGTAITGEYYRVGSALYMSPEQIQGQELDQRTDIWSLGVLLYEISVGHPPFTGSNKKEAFAAIIGESPIPPGEIREDLPVKFERLILKCLSKNRELRYTSMRQILDELDGILQPMFAGAYTVPLPGLIRETERRIAAVMAVEILGLEELTEQVDVEEAATLTKSCFDNCFDVVEKYGGWAIRTINSNWFAYFGVPTAGEEVCTAAINTAIEMRSACYRWKEEKSHSLSIDIRIGIESGLVIAGASVKDGEIDYTIVGEAVSVASMLRSTAAGGQILVGTAVREDTAGRFDYRVMERGSPAVQDSSPAFELLTAKPKTGHREVVPRQKIYSDMVGRDKELNTLNRYLLQSVIVSAGGIAAVIGEPGIGKSRLITEFKKLEQIPKITLLEGRALSHGKQMSYHPFIDMIKTWTGIKEDDSETVSYSRLEQAITSIGPGIVEEIFPFIAVLMGMRLSGTYAERVQDIEGAALAKLIGKTLREWLLQLVQNRPVVCIFNDIHWADLSSIELMESLFRTAEKYPILFIPVFRPGYEETGERLLESMRSRYGRLLSEIYLQPLAEEECQILINNLLKKGKLPVHIRSEIAQRAGGNPFFVEEVLRSFIDAGIISQKDETYEFSGDPGTGQLRIPGTIQEVLMTRLDRLEAAEVQVLKTASVIGRYFFYKILAAVSSKNQEMDHNLLHLKEIQLIAERTRLDELEYLFIHALVHEVTYGSILLKIRKELHLLVAVAVETIFNTRLHEFYGMLAFHYSRGENLEKAEEFLIKAGDEALKSAASSEALNYFLEVSQYYKSAFGAAADPEKIAGFNEKIGMAYYNKGNHRKAIEYFDKVLSHWGVTISKNKLFTTLRLIADMFIILIYLYLPGPKRKRIPTSRDHEIFNIAEKKAAALAYVDLYRFFTDALGLLKRLLKLDVEKLKNGTAIFAASSVLFSYTGISLTLGKKILQLAGRLIDRKDRQAYLVYSYIWFSLNLDYGVWEGEYGYDEQLVMDSLAKGEFFYTAVFIHRAGLLYIAMGRFSEAQAMIKKSSEVAETYDNETFRIHEYHLNTLFLVKTGKLIPALDQVEDFIALSEKAGYFITLAYTLKVYIEALLGDLEAAEKALKRAEEEPAPMKKFAPVEFNYLYLCRFMFSLRKLEAAVDNSDKSTFSYWKKRAYRSGKIAIELTDIYAPNRTETFRLMGSYYLITGNLKKALHWCSKSKAAGEHLDDRPELARTYWQIGRILADPKSTYHSLHGITKGEYLEKARALFEELAIDYENQPSRSSIV